jgi:hypothetical protein
MKVNPAANPSKPFHVIVNLPDWESYLILAFEAGRAAKLLPQARQERHVRPGP